MICLRNIPQPPLSSAPTNTIIAMLTYDTLGRKTETIFNSGAVNEYSYTGLDRIDKWEITPYNQSTIEKQFEYDQFDYLSSTGDWEIENDELGRIRYALGRGVSKRE